MIRTFQVLAFTSLVLISMPLKSSETEKPCLEGRTLGTGVAASFNVDPEEITVPHLKYKGFITASELNKYDTDTLATLILERLKSCDKKRGGNEKTTVSEHSEIMLFADMGLWNSIGKYGLQNQHVTATTKGYNDRITSYNAEATMMGMVVGYSSKSKDILPKYAGLNVFASHHFASKGHVSPANQYGNSAVVFKDHIDQRATFTPWDSLGQRQFRGDKFF